MNQIQCDVAGCQERSPADCGYNWTEVKCGEISPKGVALDYTIKHVCPKCRARFYNLFALAVMEDQLIPLSKLNTELKTNRELYGVNPPEVKK